MLFDKERGDSMQQNFKRYEMKFLLTKEQQKEILECMAPYMQLDRYGQVTIRNIYFDTPSHTLIRRSLEKPVYKEKLRVRSYRRTGMDEDVFVEIKKKYRSIVYKRRICMEQRHALDALENKSKWPDHTQIGGEIESFIRRYDTLCPAVFLTYEREAYAHRKDPDFRVTFDENILYRTKDMGLDQDVGGIALQKPDTVLMEVKTAGAIPLWMVRTLSSQHVYKTSFSKYGAAYRDMMDRRQSPDKRVHWTKETSYEQSISIDFGTDTDRDAIGIFYMPDGIDHTWGHHGRDLWI